VSNSNKVLSIADANNGMVTTAMVQAAGISRQYLTILVQNGLLERVARGVYVLPEIWNDEFVSVQTRLKRGIFSKETALLLHDLTDRTPYAYSMTFPDNYNLSNAKNEGILATRAKEPFYSMGIETVQSPSGNEIQSYNMEKTLCDILRTRSGVEIGVIAEAFKRYATNKNRNIPKLSEYAKILKVEEKVRNYLEVLL